MTSTEEAAAVTIQRVQGAKFRKISIITSVIGLFILGIPLGIAAFIYARKAEAHGVKATPWLVLGIVDIVIAIFMIVVFKPYNI